MAFAIPRFNAQPGQAVPLAPRMDPGEAAAGGLMLARAGQRAMDTSVEIQRQAQGMRRMEALAGASQEMADLAGEVDKATDPDAIRPMIQQRAQAIREKRARIIKAEAELEASRKLADAAQQMANNPVAVELRRMQMVTEVGAESNSTTVLMIPSDFVSLAKSLSEYLRERTPD